MRTKFDDRIPLGGRREMGRAKRARTRGRYFYGINRGDLPGHALHLRQQHIE